jgi:hypothetical protein
MVGCGGGLNAPLSSITIGRILPLVATITIIPVSRFGVPI